jgi:hypothetical protein
MWYKEALRTLINSLAYAAGPIITFLSGTLSAWLLFVLQENRKQAFAAMSARQSLVSELRWLESQLSITVIKCAIQSDIIPDGVKEYRWFFKEGIERNVLDEIPAQILERRERLADYSDQQITTLLRFFRRENRAIELPLTITNSVLATPTSAKLSAEEIKKLVDVRWQSAMLASEGRSMNDLLSLTFTLSDEVNHQIVVQNHKSALHMYGRRANYVLKYVRAALNELEMPRAGRNPR